MTASDQHEVPPYDETVAPAIDSSEAPTADPLAKAQAEVAELKDAWLRARAETENVRRQGQADVARAHKYAIETFAKELLPVRDALEQTLATDASVSAETLKTGAELTLKSLRNVEQVHLLVADQLNTYDVLISDDVVFTQAALEAFVAGPAKCPSATAVASSAEITEEDAK